MFHELTPFPILEWKLKDLKKSKLELSNNIAEYIYNDIVKIISLIFNKRTTSSDGYTTFDRTYVMADSTIHQHLTLAETRLIGHGKFRWEVAFMEWSRIGGHIKSGTVDWPEFINATEIITNMTNSSDKNDRVLGFAILRDQYLTKKD